MTTDQDVLESATSADGARRWRLFRRRDGLFEYREFTLDDELYWVNEDGSETDVAAPSRWLPTSVSGFFDTIEAARSDALASLPWLSGRPPR